LRGRSRPDPVATLQQLSDLDVGFVSITEALDLSIQRTRHGGYAHSIRRVRTCDSARTCSRRRCVLKVAFGLEVKSEMAPGAAA